MSTELKFKEDIINANIDNLLGDLKNIELDVIKKKLEINGFDSTTSWLGSNVTSYDYLIASGRLIVQEINRNAVKSIAEYVKVYQHRLKPIISKFFIEYQKEITFAINEKMFNDLKYDYMAVRKFRDTYLLKENQHSMTKETIQLCHMRIAVQLYYENGIDKVIRAYNELSDMHYTQATPTIFGAGIEKGQLSSCFLITCADSTENILDTMQSIGQISKNKGGIGIDISRIRHSEIGLTGNSKGLLPLMKVYDQLIDYFDQEGLRKGACTVYTRAHHLDLYAFCEASLKHGDHHLRTLNLNTAIWFPWLFWKRVEEDGYWTLFCPNKTKDLNDLWGIEFNKRYEEYEKEMYGKPEYSSYCVRIKAKKVLNHITKCQRLSGMPYVLHGDSCNMKSNQKQLGYIRCSNLCLEIVEWSDENSIPSCNLASLSLKSFVKSKTGDILNDYDWDKFSEISRNITENLNRVIDYNYYVSDKIESNNSKYRPIGIGVTGFADALYEMDIHFEHPSLPIFNKMLFACLYFNSLLRSIDEAIKDGSFVSFENSPIFNGKLQFDLWHDEFLLLKDNDLLGKNSLRKEEDDIPIDPSTWNQKEYQLCNGITVKPTWDDLKDKIKKYGLRNSLNIALMPSATTSTIMMNTETVEAPMSNLFERRLMNGSFPVMNKYLEEDARKIGVWNKFTVQLLQADYGSISKLDKLIEKIPEKYNYNGNIEALEKLKTKYKTMWELSMRNFIKLSSERGRYICQSQSFNLYFADPTDKILKAAHITGHKYGLKTGMYYLRQLPAKESSKITVIPEILKLVEEHEQERHKKINTTKKTDSESSIDQSSDQSFICFKERGCERCE